MLMPKGNHFTLYSFLSPSLRIEKSTFDPLFIFAHTKIVAHTHAYKQTQKHTQSHTTLYIVPYCIHCNNSTHLCHLFEYKLDTLNI